MMKKTAKNMFAKLHVAAHFVQVIDAFSRWIKSSLKNFIYILFRKQTTPEFFEFHFRY